MSPNSREPRQKPEDDLNFFVNYWNHCHAIEEKHRQLFGPKVIIGDFLKTSASIAATKINFFSPLCDGHDYLDEVMGVLFIPVACVGLTVVAFLFAALKIMHMLAIVVNIAEEAKEDNLGQETLEGLILGFTFPLLAVASLVKCAISMITRPLSTLVQGLHQFDDDDENRFLVVSSPSPFSFTG